MFTSRCYTSARDNRAKFTRYSWHRNVFLQVFTICNLTSIFNLFFTMYILTADRLVCILTPLKHRIYFPRRRMKIVIMISWIVSFLLGMLQYYLREIPVIQHMAIGIGALFIILVIITYSIIIHKLQQSRRRFRSSRTTHPRQVIKFRKEFLLPTMIIFNFIILFYVTLVLITVTGRLQHYILQITYYILHITYYILHITYYILHITSVRWVAL